MQLIVSFAMAVFEVKRSRFSDYLYVNSSGCLMVT